MPASQSGNGGPKSKAVYKALKPSPADEPLPPVTEPALSLCDLAKRTLERALENWATASGRSVAGYKVGTRSVTYLTQSDAFNAVNSAINMVIKLCGPGALPGGLEEFGGAARRVIPSDV